VDRIGFDVSGGPQARSPAQGQIRLQAPQMTTQVRVMTPMGAGVRAPTLQHRIVTVSAPTTAASNTTTVRLTTVSPRSFAITACKHDSLVSRSYLRKNGDTILNLMANKPQYFGSGVVTQ
jgi:hypothetical protein